MTSGFQSDVNLHILLIYNFVHFKFMFLTYGMSVGHNISDRVCTLFLNKKKEENMRLVSKT